MGIYLSEPNKEKINHDGETSTVREFVLDKIYKI